MPKRRANGEGNIRKRKDGRWEGRYTVGHDPETGKAIIKNVLGKTQAEVKEKLKKAIKVLVKRKLIAMYKHRNPYGYSNNECHLLSLDNPEIYRDLDTEADELPLFIGEELPA